MPNFCSVDEMLSAIRSHIHDHESEAYQMYEQFTPEYLAGLFEQGRGELEVEHENHMSDGCVVWARDEWKFLSDPRSGHLTAMLLVHDIHNRKQEVEKLAHAARTDEMTGLLNRATAIQLIEAYLKDDGTERKHAIFMIDLDDFKQVNDTYGHQAGDLLLMELAQGFKKCFRNEDLVCRLGGDEFLIFAKNMNDHRIIRRRADELLEVARGVYASQTTAIGSVSIGVCTYPEDGTTFNELYEKADSALYKAKNNGKNCVAFARTDVPQWSINARDKRYDAYNSQVIDHSNFICYISDMETYDLLHLTKAGMAFYDMTKPEEYLGKKCYQVIAGLDAPCPFCTNCKLKEGMEYRWERYNDKIDKWFDRTSSIIHLDGRPCHLEIAQNITARKEAHSLVAGDLGMEDVLFRCLHILSSEQDMDTALNLFLEAVGGFYQANRSYIFEFDFEKQKLDNTFEWCTAGVSAEIENLQQLPLELVDGWVRKFKTDGEFSISSLDKDVVRDSEEYRILEMQGIESLMAAPLLDGNTIVGFIGVDDPRQNQGNLTLLRSVSEFVRAELERRRLMQELEHMSFIDGLTGLRNRNHFGRVLKEYDRRNLKSMGLVLLDINGLKIINDSHGQSYGDHVIKRVGRILSGSLSGQVFRTGGGEFTTFCEAMTKDQFQQDVDLLRDAFANEHDYSVSIGSVWTDGDCSAQQLLLQAEEMLQADKGAYYHAVLREGRSTGGASFSDEVAREISEGRFVVYYQPQVDIQTEKIVGAEALVRKKDVDGSLIPPNKFIPFYEREGVIGLVDLHVLDTACATMHNWLEEGHDLQLSVNFSRVTLLEPGIVDEMCRICEQNQVSTSHFNIEVTESISKMDHDQLRSLIQSIHKAGFTISLDDFGSQYSNLAILAAMDFDEIKFDKSLIKALEHNRKSQVVMENSVRMCRDLEGTSSLAEGIETRGQLELLADYRCNYGQGYYFSKPVPREEFQRMLKLPRQVDA